MIQALIHVQKYYLFVYYLMDSARHVLRSDLTIEVATAHKVAGMFGRRDPMRRFMDKIIAMIDEIGTAMPGS